MEPLTTAGRKSANASKKKPRRSPQKSSTSHQRAIAAMRTSQIRMSLITCRTRPRCLLRPAWAPTDYTLWTRQEVSSSPCCSTQSPWVWKEAVSLQKKPLKAVTIMNTTQIWALIKHKRERDWLTIAHLLTRHPQVAIMVSIWTDRQCMQAQYRATPSKTTIERLKWTNSGQSCKRPSAN